MSDEVNIDGMELSEGSGPEQVPDEISHNQKTQALFNALYDPPDSSSISALRRMAAEDKFDASEDPEGEEEGSSSTDDKEGEDDAETKDAKKTEEAEDSEEAEASETEEDDEGEQEVLDETGEIKFKEREISFMVGDDVTKVPNNAVVEITVDGKTKKLYLQEALNRASGDVAVQKRLEDTMALNQQMQRDNAHRQAQWKQRQAIIDDTVETYTTFMKYVTEDSPEKTLVYCARKLGLDPLVTVRKFMENTSQWKDKFDSLDEAGSARFEENLGVEVRRQELEEKESKLAKDKERKDEEDEEARINTYGKKQLEKHGATFKEFQETIDSLNDTGIDLSDIDDPEEKIDTILDYLHEARVLKAADAVDPNLRKDVKTLTTVFNYTNVENIRSEEAIKKILKGILSKTQKKEEDRIAENLSRKAQKNGAKPQKAKEANGKTDEDDFGPMSLNDFQARYPI